MKIVSSALLLSLSILKPLYAASDPLQEVGSLKTQVKKVLVRPENERMNSDVLRMIDSEISTMKSFSPLSLNMASKILLIQNTSPSLGQASDEETYAHHVTALGKIYGELISYCDSRIQTLEVYKKALQTGKFLEGYEESLLKDCEKVKEKRERFESFLTLIISTQPTIPTSSQTSFGFIQDNFYNGSENMHASYNSLGGYAYSQEGQNLQPNRFDVQSCVSKYKNYFNHKYVKWFNRIPTDHATKYLLTFYEKKRPQSPPSVKDPVQQPQSSPKEETPPTENTQTDPKGNLEDSDSGFGGLF